MKVQGKGTTIAGEIYISLRESILNGQVRPSDKIRPQELCERYGVSLGAVRESLSQLMAEGLVLSEAHRGFTVASISVEDLRDLTRIRIEIESVCLRWSMELGAIDWESEVIAATHRLTKTHHSDDQAEVRPQWIAAHDVYHLALVSACGSTRLLRIRQQLYDQSERYRKLESALVRHRDSEDEHQRIADAAVARNTALACRLIAEHISRTTDNIIKVMEKKATAASRSINGRQKQSRHSQQPSALSRPALPSAQRRR